jgi:hypothetical protein
MGRTPPSCTRRQTYATEEAVQRLEAEQAKGDELILRLEDQLRRADAELARCHNFMCDLLIQVAFTAKAKVVRRSACCYCVVHGKAQRGLQCSRLQTASMI